MSKLSRVVNLRRRPPKTLIENRVSSAGPEAELSIYDTYLPANDVGLTAGELLYCGMIKGRKLLHGRDGFESEFLPCESFVLAPGESIAIDFPDAEMESPTSCLTIEISQSRIQQVCDRLNHQSPRAAELEEWHMDHQHRIHTGHSHDTQRLLERLVHNFAEPHDDRDLLIDFGISELVVRMLRHQTRNLLLQLCARDPEANGLTAAIKYLIDHFNQPLDIDRLWHIACMSRSRFFKEFKNHLGCTPAEFQILLRLQKAADMLRQHRAPTEVCYAVGFQDPSHFSKKFHAYYGITPREYGQQA